ncbi:hypothetical protein [Syntrophomonas wolfei]|uniref:Uncharacterized protein n=1 Tax=Syntrophomonas wolfei TaxID=863 RepID=A0A354YWD3_9FIRM|nr:hypothetical protein [Syntrophomonas wolfei]HBK52562.1 hypothetical protein [Syntrophomonas wolfei]
MAKTSDLISNFYSISSPDKKWSMIKDFTRAKYSAGLFWEVKSLVKKAKSVARNRMLDPSVLEDIPAKDPHAEYAKKDALFKQRRGAQR